ncbi:MULTISPECIES: hypothetical protein [Arthrobacter]|uniref:TupA-like ATPgrasp n=2 Tax=Arthrobacter TaxID=1663 RepID=A0ABU9KGA7_9MICC|nr:hypothetical protein [Arthrobacter sp. YJM1]MDP5225921.1 hypothetical protein [Arthrobacter sp. YJM1]
MKTLANELYAPMTDEIGFIRAPLEHAADVLATWYHRLERQVTVTEVNGRVHQWEASLAPFEMGANGRVLLLETHSDWVALTNNAVGDSGAGVTAEMVAKYAGVEAAALSAVPHTLNSPKLKGISEGRYGGCRFDYFAPNDQGEVVQIRGLQAVHGGGSKWEFYSFGEVQPYEEPEAYENRRVRDRFTSDMLERYCQTLGIDVFNEDFYGPRGLLVDYFVNDDPPTYSFTLEQVQAWKGIVPGRSTEFPG